MTRHRDPEPKDEDNGPWCTTRQALSQAYGYIHWCLPRGHLWTGRSDEHPNWRGVCVTCGKVAAPRPGWRRFILMGDCAPTSEVQR